MLSVSQVLTHKQYKKTIKFQNLSIDFPIRIVYTLRINNEDNMDITLIKLTLKSARENLDRAQKSGDIAKLNKACNEYAIAYETYLKAFPQDCPQIEGYQKIRLDILSRV
jgi:hypothetical protein